MSHIDIHSGIRLLRFSFFNGELHALAGLLFLTPYGLICGLYGLGPVAQVVRAHA